MPLQPRSSFVSSKSIIARPPLPTDHANPFIKRIETSSPPPVKFQEIVRDGHTTVVGRIKIPTPGGHAFILRRLDTGAISLTTMFRAAFPTAPEDAEKAETSWVKLTYDTTGANKSGKARFAGTWVTPEVADSLAEGYALADLIRPLTAATPNPEAIHRKKSTPTQHTPVSSPTPPVVATTPRDGPNPAKRRREASPAPSPSAATTTPKPPPAAKSTPLPSRAEKPVESTPSRLPVTSKRAPSPARSVVPPVTPGSLRRSTRLKSPAPTSAPSSERTVVGSHSPKTPKVAMTAIREEVTPGGSDETAVDEDAAIARATEVDMHEDVREQRALIERLKAERVWKNNIQGEKTQEVIDVDASDEEVTLVNLNSASSKAQKRAREEEQQQLRFNFREGKWPQVGEQERAIVSNSRARGRVTAERKQLAWGALAFAAGLSAIAYLPNLPSFF